MTSVITATALVIRPPDGTAGSAYREIGRVRSRTSTIRMTCLARFHPPTTTLPCSGSIVLSDDSRNCPAVLSQRCLAKAIFQIAALPHADMARVLWSSTELTSRWVCVSGGAFSAEIDAQRRIIAGIQFAACRDDLVSLVSPSKS